MKLVDKGVVASVPFNKVPDYSVVKWNDNYYMKIPVINRSVKYNAVGLAPRNGIVHFENIAMVVVVDATLVIGGD